MQFERLFSPRAIAIIGASRNAAKVGGSIVQSVVEGGFRGHVYPVNPHERRIAGQKSYPSVRAIQGVIDLAVIAIPAALVPQALRECGIKKIPFVVVVSAGFGETGPAGKEREAELRKIAKRYNLHLLGPNCLGFISASSRLNASFAGTMPLSGGISCVSQSGALLVSFIDWSKQQGLGVEKLVSIGNQAGVSDVALLEYLQHDPLTSVIGVYLERIANPKSFFTALRRCTKVKPVVILKSGTSPAGMRAALSHTGSIAGSDTVIAELLLQAGAVRAHDMEDFFKLLQCYAYRRGPSASLAIVTNAGGPGIAAADAVSQTNVRLAEFAPSTITALRRVLPPHAALMNPVDVVGDADVERFAVALRVIERDPGCDTVLVIITPQFMTPLVALARMLVRHQKRSHKRIIVCYVGGSKVAAARKILALGNVMHCDYPHDAVRVCAATAVLPSSLRYTPHFVQRSEVSEGTFLSYAQVQRLLIRNDFPLHRGAIVTDGKGVSAIRRFPVAAKALSPAALHKMKANAVTLDIGSSRELREVVSRYARSFRAKGFEGVLVQPMAQSGLECIMGVTYDVTVGLTILFGLGGTYAEELHDTVLHLGPITSLADARTFIARIRHANRLHGYDVGYLARLIKRLSDFAAAHPAIQEIDFNPVTVYAKGGVIIDARIKTTQK